MFLAILLSPIVFLACFVLPFVGTIFSREHSAKWVAFWLLQILGSWTLIPFFELFLECQMIMLLKAFFAIGLIFALNANLIKTLTTQVQNLVGIVSQQKQNVEQQVSKVAKQYGIIE